jgi:hypothetical protein
MVCEADVATRVRRLAPCLSSIPLASILSHFLCPPSSLSYNQFFAVAGLVTDNQSRPRNEESA